MIRCYVTDRRRADIRAAARRAVADGVDMIQVREKDLEAKALLELVEAVIAIARGSAVRVIVNDRLDVALAAGAHGVHLPANGIPASRVAGLVSMVGVSTHSAEEALRAEREGADYVFFGPVFESPGKRPVGVGKLREAAGAVRIPLLAIGGITPGNAAEAMEAGASGIAAIRMFQEGPDPSDR